MLFRIFGNRVDDHPRNKNDKDKKLEPKMPSKIAFYSGKNSGDANEFIDDCTLNCKNCNHHVSDDSLSIPPIAAMFLRDAAKSWYFAWEKKYPTNKKTWGYFKKKFRKAFLPDNYQTELRNQISKLKQQHSVYQHNQEFRKLINRVDSMKFEDQLQYYVKGLKTSTSKHVQISKPKDIDEAINIAQRYEDIYYPEQEEQRQKKNYHNYGNKGYHRNNYNTSSNNKSYNKSPKQYQGTTNKPWDNKKQDTIICFYCNKSGHYKNKCRKLQNDTKYGKNEIKNTQKN